MSTQRSSTSSRFKSRARDWDFISVPVLENTKTRVRQFAEDDGFSSMAGWVRSLVVREVNRREQMTEAR